MKELKIDEINKCAGGGEECHCYCIHTGYSTSWTGSSELIGKVACYIGYLDQYVCDHRCSQAGYYSECSDEKLPDHDGTSGNKTSKKPGKKSSMSSLVNINKKAM